MISPLALIVLSLMTCSIFSSLSNLCPEKIKTVCVSPASLINTLYVWVLLQLFLCQMYKTEESMYYLHFTNNSFLFNLLYPVIFLFLHIFLSSITVGIFIRFL